VLQKLCQNVKRLIEDMNMKDYQFTKSEIESRSLLLVENTDINDMLLMSGDSWGDVYLATREQWEDEIPEDEDEAKSTGYYDWYLNDADKWDSWDEYRDNIFTYLRSIELFTYKAYLNDSDSIFSENDDEDACLDEAIENYSNKYPSDPSVDASGFTVLLQEI
jgi:hypothetical protein